MLAKRKDAEEQRHLDTHSFLDALDVTRPSLWFCILLQASKACPDQSLQLGMSTVLLKLQLEYGVPRMPMARNAFALSSLEFYSIETCKSIEEASHENTLNLRRTSRRETC